MLTEDRTSYDFPFIVLQGKKRWKIENKSVDAWDKLVDGYIYINILKIQIYFISVQIYAILQ